MLYSLFNLDFFTGQCITVENCQCGNCECGKPCLFPWRFNNNPTVYDGCADPDGSGYPWCATGLTSDGKYINRSGKWGICDMDKCNLAGENVKKHTSSTMCFLAPGMKGLIFWDFLPSFSNHDRNNHNQHDDHNYSNYQE